MACGTPVIATAVGGIPEQIEEGVTGFLTPLADSESMAERILQLIGDDTLRQAMGRFAARIAREAFSAHRMIDNYIRWYEEIIEHWHNEQTHELD